MTIPIEKGVPRPTNHRLGAEEMAPELARMEAGDSIFIPNKPGSGFPPVSAVSVARYGLHCNKQFDSEYEDDGLRVWRTR